MLLKWLTMAAMMIIVRAQATHDDDPHHPRVKRALPHVTHPRELDAEFWINKAQNILKRHLSRKVNTNLAKNVILFLGDGLSFPTLAASRAYLGQHVLGSTGEETTLYFEDFPNTGLSRTYCVDMQVADSACSATAYLGGVKANWGTIGVTAAVKRQDCEASLNATNQVRSVAHWAQKAGKATGLVTTTRVTHASPAGVYAHVADRGWEHDAAVSADGKLPHVCPDIAQQLILGETGSQLNVILGGGRRYFYPDTLKDSKGTAGKRKDEKNLIETWRRKKEELNATYAYVTNRQELLEVPSEVDYLLGLFNPCHMSYHLDNNKDEPKLEEMTVAAINNLKKSPNGFFLFVEGGRIDHAHHDNLAKKSLDETVEFAKAVAAADALTSAEDTLIVVTADHSHVMSLSGYAHRGTNIFGFAGDGADGIPYMTLSYSNGPGSQPTLNAEKGSKRPDPRKQNTEHKLYRFPAMVPLPSETHGGDDVGVYARGPWAHLFTGSYEQNFIPHAMGYAACLGDGANICQKRSFY